MALVGNGGRLGWVAYFHRDFLESVFGLFLINLNLADFLMGVYLLVIGSADQVYGGVYLWHDTVWKGSTACKVDWSS